MIRSEDGSTVAVSGTSEADAGDPAHNDVYALPCSVVQRSCWFLEQMSPGTATNNIAVRFQLTGDLRPDLLARALNEIARRHETLRTRFISRDGEPMQLIEPDLPVDLPVDDLSPQPDFAERVAVEEAAVAFDISKGPLWRARLLRVAPREFVLLITIHHMIADGWSIGIITEELGEIYGALADGLSASLPELSIQYADYAAWQNDALANELAPQLDYWKRQLADYQPLRIPTDLPRPAKPLNRGKIRSVVLPRAVTDSLKRLSDQQGCTLFVTMLAAFQALMRHESGQRDIVVRTQTAGRGRMELEPLIGWFVNSVLLRADVPAAATFLELLKTTQQVALEGLANQDVPFERVIDVARPRQELSHHAPFPVNFIFQRDFVKTWTRGGVTLTAAPSVAAGTFVDLNVFLVERADGWRASVDVNLDVFRPETGDRFLENYQTVLETVSRDPGIVLSALPLPPPRAASQPLTHGPRAGATRLEPRDQLETDLLAIWKEALACDSLAVDTNFFDVGGHSLLAVKMLSAVQKKFGRSLNLAALFTEPTVLAMARALRAQFTAPAAAPVHATRRQTPSTSKINVIPIQPFGQAPPFFMVGGDHWFRPLAKRLGPDQPFLGLSLMSYERRSEPTSFDEISTDLAQVIMDLRTPDPILIGGWCVDGSIAYEVAQKLVHMDQEVALVVLIDAINPVYRREFRTLGRRVSRAVKRTQTLARQVMQIRGSGAAQHAWSGMRDLVSRAARAFARRGRAKTEWDLVMERSDSSRQEFRRLLYLAENDYVPTPINCPIALVRSPITEFQDPDLGWKRLTPAGLDTVEVAADHIGMFREPYVEYLAAALRPRIEVARVRRS